jgi:arylsulfatase A-like enzyme
VWSDIVTLPAYLKNHGYWTQGAGKNFHHTAGFNDPGAWSDYYHWNPAAVKNGWEEGYQKPPDPEPAAPHWSQFRSRNPEFDAAALEVPDHAVPDNKVAEFAAKFLAEKHAQPFFLSIGMFRPHVPYYVPKKYFDLYPLDPIELPPYKADDLADIPAIAIKQTTSAKSDMHATVVRDGLWKAAIQAYLASITFADAQLGVVLDALEKSAYAKNTIVILWSDHGFHLGEKNHWAKWTLWRRTTHVPLVVYAPGLTQPVSRTPAR